VAVAGSMSSFSPKDMDAGSLGRPLAGPADEDPGFPGLARWIRSCLLQSSQEPLLPPLRPTLLRLRARCGADGSQTACRDYPARAGRR
jgi:hypothetical protein